MADPVELLPPTQNFRIFYDPTLNNALGNALQFARTVESDFQTLVRWFLIDEGFGPGNRVTVNLIYKDGSGSNNRGYHDDGSTTLNLNGAPFGTPVADIIRMHFVAEFSEVLMSYNNQHGPTTWEAGKSHGEGLSQYCAYTMAPAGYNSFYGPRFENTWLRTLGRQDWVNNTEGTDGNVYSYGCSLLYIFYLHSQLGYSTEAIVRNGADTLASTYNKLTGRADAYVPFDSLLARFYPSDQSDAVLDVVNPFPLLEGPGRRVDLDAVSSDFGNVLYQFEGETVTRPYFNCPPKLYSFTVYGQPNQIVATAKTFGFAGASFNWYLNGLVMTGNSGSVRVPIQLASKDPGAPGGQILSSAHIDVTWQIIASTHRTSTIVLTAFEPYGKYELDIEVHATETWAIISPSSVGLDTKWLDTETVRWSDAYNADHAACSKAFNDIAHRYVRHNPYFRLILTLPDPPEQFEAALRLLRSLGRELHSLEEAPQAVQHGIDQLLRARLGISSGMLRDLADHQPHPREGFRTSE